MVDAVSVEVEVGEVVGLLGPNGAGKTTSFYMIVGLISPDAGRVMLDDEEITPLAMYERARAIRPQFLLLDEPFSGIDPIQVLEIQRIIADLKKSGIGILITDHNVRETLAVTDRAYIINDGRIFRSGSPATLAGDPEVRKVYLGEGFELPG